MTLHRILSESITHIEDLPVDRFIDVLRDMPSLSAQEKLDGANLWLGVDDEGKLYTSREGKRAGADRKYDAGEWALVSANNQFRAAHTALRQYAEEIKQVLQPGDTVEVEVLFGKQPNSVTYGAGGKSYIAFLRGVNGTSDEVAEKLGAALASKETKAQTTIVDTTDGEQIEEVNEIFTFQFVTPQKVDAAKLSSEAGLEDRLKKFEAFLHEPSSVNGFTNYQLLSVNLQQVPKEERSAVKQARADLQSKVQIEFKLPIKQALLDKITVKSNLSDDDDGIGIEGIVLRNSVGDQIKIVDKDVFSTINKFNQHVRHTVKGALISVDPDTDTGNRGGLLGELRIQIAEVFGNRELAKASNIRSVLKTVQGETPEQTIKNFADSMAAVTDVETTRKKILALISQCAKDLKASLEEFKTKREDYHLRLKSGKEIKLSDDVVKRTLLTYAESRKSLTELFDKIKSTKSIAQILAVLYGSHAKELHNPSVNESVLLEKKAPSFGDIDHSSFKQDTFHIVNCYLAATFISMLILHEGDVIGMRFIHDRAHMTLKKWSRKMSPFNHWGYGIWRCADIKEFDRKTKHELISITKRIRRIEWKNLHRDFSTNKSMKIRWSEHQTMLQRLIDLAGLRTDRLNSLLDCMIKWPELQYDEKVKTLNVLYMLALRFIPRSLLFNRLRVIQHNLLVNATGINSQMVTENLLKTIVALAEEGEEGGGDVPEGQPVNVSIATTSAAVSSVPMPLTNRIVKRKRNPDVVKRFTMKFHDPRKD
jgi:hypothetical protein